MKSQVNRIEEELESEEEVMARPKKNKKLNKK